MRPIFVINFQVIVLYSIYCPKTIRLSRVEKQNYSFQPGKILEKSVLINLEHFTFLILHIVFLKKKCFSFLMQEFFFKHKDFFFIELRIICSYYIPDKKYFILKFLIKLNFSMFVSYKPIYPVFMYKYTIIIAM